MSHAVAPPLPPPPDVDDDLPARAWPRWTGWVAWGVIVAVCLGLPVLRAERKADKADAVEASAAPAAVDFQTKLAGRYAVGTARLTAGAAGGEAAKLSDVLATAASTPEGSIATAVVVGELRGAAAAAERLRQINDPDAPVFLSIYDTATTRPATQARQSTPATVPATVPATRATHEDLVAMESRFGWFARLADAFGKPDTDAARAAVLAEAQKTVLAVGAAAAVLFTAGVVGLGLMITAIVLAATGKLRLTVGPPTGPAAVYVESMALYLGGFVVISLLIGRLVREPSMTLQVLGLGSVVLLAAAWPLIRGVPLGVVRRDWGVHAGRGFALEAVAGLGGYLAGLPVMAVGVLITLGLIWLTHVDASHPIMQDTGDSGWMLLGLASVFAPLTEELLFRGALVSHLRAGVNAVVAALVSGLVFASVHPQGWAAIPALTGIAVVFAMIRQWRGSLVPSIVAHAVHNGMLVTFLILVSR